MAIKICIDKLEVENFEINKADIIIKFGILKFKLNKEKLKKIISSNKSKIKLEVNDFKEVQFSNAPVPAFLSVVMSTVFKEVQFLNAFSARA